MGTSSKKDKWSKYQYLYSSLALRPYLPETALFSENNFWYFTRQYEAVIVKPRNGSRGRNVFQIKKKGHDRYGLHIEKKKLLLGADDIYEYLRRRVGSDGNYIVQERISRAKIRNRPFDLRVIVQRWNGSSKWMVTAQIAKLAGKGYIVSNITRSSGRLIRVSKAIRQSTISGRSAQKIKEEINAVAISCARKLTNYFPDQHIYGLDIALDRSGRVWIIEANLCPSMSHFDNLKDRRMYRRIMAVKRNRPLTGYMTKDGGS